MTPNCMATAFKDNQIIPLLPPSGYEIVSDSSFMMKNYFQARHHEYQLVQLHHVIKDLCIGSLIYHQDFNMFYHVYSISVYYHVCH